MSDQQHTPEMVGEHVKVVAALLPFLFFDSPHPQINRDWIEELMVSAGGPNGLAVTPEPVELTRAVVVASSSAAGPTRLPLDVPPRVFESGPDRERD